MPKKSHLNTKTVIAIVFAGLFSLLILASAMTLAMSDTDSRSYAAPRSKTRINDFQVEQARVGCDYNNDGRSDCNIYTQDCINNRCVSNGSETGVPCDWNADGIGPDCNAQTQECAPDGSRCMPRQGINPPPLD